MLYLTCLSYAVKKIASKEIKEEDVAAIIVDTHFESCEDAIKEYSSSYWKDNLVEFVSVCRRIWPKVIQSKVVLGKQYVIPVNKLYYSSLEELKELGEVKLRRGYKNAIPLLIEGGYLK